MKEDDKVKLKRVIASILIICITVNIAACSFEETKETAKEKASTAVDAFENVASNAKNTVVDWYSNLDLSHFKEGWEHSVEFLGAQYSAAMSSEYIANVEAELATLKTDINAAAGSARGTAQEAGFLAEKWASDTFNINAVANGSDYRAEVVGSNEFGSVDVATNYGENASLKYYKDASSSASAQAKTILESYKDYCAKTTKSEPPTLGESLKDANPSIVATLTILAIEAAIHGYELSQGKITAEEYGNMMVDRVMIAVIALPTSALLLSALPATKIAMMAGCMAGGMLACVGYMVAKNAVMDIVDGGGFEAVIPVEAANTMSIAKEKIASLKLEEGVSSLKDSIVSTANDGYIKVSSLVQDN